MVGESSEDFYCMMTMIMDPMLHERNNTVGIDKAIQRTVDANKKYVSRYVEPYKMEMQMRNLPETRQFECKYLSLV